MLSLASRSLFVLAGCLVACASSTEGVANDKGTAPQVSNLTLSSTTLASGKATTLTGSIQFTDPDADLDSFEITIGAAGQPNPQKLPSTKVANAQGQRSGTVQLTLIVQAPAAGAYQAEFYALDAKGNTSNKLTVSLTAQ
jgi:hypothetical protein